MATISALVCGKPARESFTGGTVTHAAAEIHSQDIDEAVHKEQEGIH
jgi:hypothetical protein